MKTVVALALATIFVCGCHTAKNVAVTSFRVIDAPASYLRRHIDPQDQTTTTTTTSVASSDTVTPGRPVDVAPRESRRTVSPTVSANRSTAASTSRRSTTADVSPRSSASPAARTAANPAQFPTAKPVPGKAGYVFSPFDPSGGYVDVTGYPSGSKAKDPYSQKIFIVP